MDYLALYELSECHHACPVCGAGIVDRRQKFCGRERARGKRPNIEYIYFVESVTIPGRYKIGYTALYSPGCVAWLLRTRAGCD